MSKIAVKLEEYRREDKAKKDGYARNQISEGLKVLSDDELKVFIELSAKIHANDPEYDIDPEVRMFVEHVQSDRFGTKSEAKTKSTASKYKLSEAESNSVSARNRSGQAENRRERRSEEPDEISDLDLDFDDLSLDEDNTIPSEKTDPDWLKRERRRRRR